MGFQSVRQAEFCSGGSEKVAEKIFARLTGQRPVFRTFGVPK